MDCLCDNLKMTKLVCFDLLEYSLVRLFYISYFLFMTCSTVIHSPKITLFTLKVSFLLILLDCRILVPAKKKRFRSGAVVVITSPRLDWKYFAKNHIFIIRINSTPLNLLPKQRIILTEPNQNLINMEITSIINRNEKQ